jgi:hypothetical protein
VLSINTDQSRFTATIPAAGYKTFVEFYIVATDNNQITYRSPVNDSEDNYRFGLGLITSIEESELAISLLSVYPNPSSGKINISYSSEHSDEIAFLQVSDLRGKLIHQQKLSLLNGSTKFILNLQNSPAGMYVIEMVSAAGIQRSSVIIR